MKVSYQLKLFKILKVIFLRLRLSAGTKWNADRFVHQHSCSVPVEATSKHQTWVTQQYLLWSLMTCIQKFSTWTQTFLIKFFQDQMMFNSINFCTLTAWKQLSHLCHIYPDDFFSWDKVNISTENYCIFWDNTQHTSLTAVCFSNLFCHSEITFVRKIKDSVMQFAVSLWELFCEAVGCL